MLNSKVKEYLDSLEKDLKALKSPSGEHLIARRVTDILEQEGGYKPTKEDKAEFIAFDLTVIHQNADEQKTYYEPMFSFTYEDKKEYVPPSIKAIDQNMLEYWEKKARESKNPILSSRYADLVVDFSPMTLDEEADVDLFRVVIDSNITICEQSLVVAFDCKTKIHRALVLAIRINDKKRIAKVKDTIIKLEKNIARDDMPELWGFALRWLLLDYSKKVALEGKERHELVSEAEELLKRVTADPLLTKDSVDFLAEHYKSKNDEVNLMRVLGVLENSIKADKLTNSHAFIKVSSYEKIRESYEKYAYSFPKAAKAYYRVTSENETLDLNEEFLLELPFVKKPLKSDVGNYLKEVFGEVGNANLKMVMCKIARWHLPQRAALKKMLDEISSIYPIPFLSPYGLPSGNAMPITKSSSKDEIKDEFLIFYSSRLLPLLEVSQYLAFTMDELRRLFTKERIIEYFEKSLVFENENNNYLKRAISSYFDEDYLLSSHLFIPLIEERIRELALVCGGEIWKPNTSKRSDYWPLGRLLNDTKVISFFLQIDNDILFYFKLMLTEKRGFNLRNDFAHGIGKRKFFLRYPSDSLFHILIYLTLVTERECV